MRSAGHRQNILQPRFHVIGIRIGAGAPTGGRLRQDLHDGLRQLSYSAG